MKRPYINSKTMRVIAALTASANLFTACGQFKVDQNAFSRPPTTSNLFEAETESDLEAFKSNKAPSAPFLDSAEATRAFEEDVTGSPRTQTDDQLADVLETQHQEQLKQADKKDDSTVDDDSDKTMPEQTLPTDRSQTRREYQNAKARDSAPGPNKTARTTGQREAAAPGPKAHANSGATGSDVMPAKAPLGDIPWVPSVPENAPAPKAKVAPSNDSANNSGKVLGDIPWVPSVPTDASTRKKKVISQPVLDTTSSLPAQPPLPPQRQEVKPTVQVNKEQWERTQEAASGTVSAQRKARRAANPHPVPPEVASRRQKVIEQISKNICDVVNVKSSVPEDLAYLYFDKKALPTKLPADVLQQQQGNAKKNMFVCLLLPHAIRMDAQVYSQRLEVIRLQGRSRKGTITDDDNKWLSELKRAYRMPDNGSFTDLLARVDVVPLPLILTQAAFESEWGTSKGARQTNNLFGMHSNDHKNCMEGFDTGGKSCLRNFRSVTEGISMYIRLLDAGTYFGKFREIRAQLRMNGEKLDSEKLLAGMGAYSERGGKYISDVISIMKGSNRIDKYELDERKVREASVDGSRPRVNQ